MTHFQHLPFQQSVIHKHANASPSIHCVIRIVLSLVVFIESDQTGLECDLESDLPTDTNLTHSATFPHWRALSNQPRFVGTPNHGDEDALVVGPMRQEPLFLQTQKPKDDDEETDIAEITWWRQLHFEKLAVALVVALVRHWFHVPDPVCAASSRPGAVVCFRISGRDPLVRSLGQPFLLQSRTRCRCHQQTE